MTLDVFWSKLGRSNGAGGGVAMVDDGVGDLEKSGSSRCPSLEGLRERLTMLL